MKSDETDIRTSYVIFSVRLRIYTSQKTKNFILYSFILLVIRFQTLPFQLQGSVRYKILGPSVFTWFRIPTILHYDIVHFFLPIPNVLNIIFYISRKQRTVNIIHRLRCSRAHNNRLHRDDRDGPSDDSAVGREFLRRPRGR